MDDGARERGSAGRRRRAGRRVHDGAAARQPLVVLGRYAEADRTWQGAADQTGDADQIALAAAARASNRFWRLDDRDGAFRVLDEASARVVDGPAADTITVMRALLLLFEGRTARSLVLCRRVRRRGRTFPAALMMCAGVEALGRGVRGETWALTGPPGLTAATAGVHRRGDLAHLHPFGLGTPTGARI